MSTVECWHQLEILRGDMVRGVAADAILAEMFKNIEHFASPFCVVL